MADVTFSSDPLTGLYQDHSDIRREAVEHTNEIVREGLKGDFSTMAAIKDTRHDVSDVVGSAADRLQNDITAGTDHVLQRNADYFIANQNRQAELAQGLAALKATTDMGILKAASDISSGIDRAMAASALEAARLTAAVQLGHAQLERSVYQDGNDTRRLINDLKYNDLNRALIERNSELVEEREGRRHWRHMADQSGIQGQFAALQSQIQNFGSQLNDTRNSMVNFGTQLGVGQRSTSNNVG